MMSVLPPPLPGLPGSGLPEFPNYPEGYDSATDEDDDFLPPPTMGNAPAQTEPASFEEDVKRRADANNSAMLNLTSNPTTNYEKEDSDEEEEKEEDDDSAAAYRFGSGENTKKKGKGVMGKLFAKNKALTNLPSPKGDTILEGYVDKRNKGKTWQRRYYCLYDEGIWYYENEQQKGGSMAKGKVLVAEVKQLRLAGDNANVVVVATKKKTEWCFPVWEQANLFFDFFDERIDSQKCIYENAKNIRAPRESKILMEGTLKKKRKKAGTLIERYFVLYKEGLWHYATKQERDFNSAKGTIGTFEMSQVVKTGSKLIIETMDRPHEFECETEKVAEDWLVAFQGLLGLKRAMQHPMG
jgi:hypothetical protein